MRSKKTTLAAAVIMALALAGCSGSGGSTRSASSGVDTGGGGGGGGGGGVASATGVEGVVQDTANIVDGVGGTVARLGDAISQQSLPLLGNSVTSGTGEVITHTGLAVNSLAQGLHDGLGMYRTNDNALGVTVGGVGGAVSDAGRGVGALGNTVAALNELPVLVQLDGATGVVTKLGATVSALGMKTSMLGDTLTLTFTDEQGHLSGLTGKLTMAVRPVIANVEGTTQYLGDALIIGPVLDEVLSNVGGVLMSVDSKTGGLPLLSEGGDLAGGVGQLLTTSGTLVTAGDGGNAACGTLGNGIDCLVGGVFDAVDTHTKGAISPVTGGAFVLVDGATDVVDGLTGKLLGNAGDLLSGATLGDKVDGVVVGLTGSVDKVTGNHLTPVTGTVNNVVDGTTNVVDQLAGYLLGALRPRSSQ